MDIFSSCVCGQLHCRLCRGVRSCLQHTICGDVDVPVSTSVCTAISALFSWQTRCTSFTLRHLESKWWLVSVAVSGPVVAAYSCLCMHEQCPCLPQARQVAFACGYSYLGTAPPSWLSGVSISNSVMFCVSTCTFALVLTQLLDILLCCLHVYVAVTFPVQKYFFGP